MHHRFRLTPYPVALLFAVSSACTVYEREFYVGHDHLTIARVERPDGSVENYELDVGGAASGASLTVRTEYERERAFLGLRVVELDKATAEPRGIAPYRGLLVTGTFPRSAAAEAGLVAGDVVLAIGADRTVYAEQLTKIEAQLAKDRPIGVQVLRGGDTLSLDVSPRALREKVVEPQAIELESAPGRRPYAGIVMRGIPAAWCRRIYGDDRNAVVIAGVDLGSPAWASGFRAGDLIERIDGAPVGNVGDLARMIHARGQAGGAVELDVRRGLDERFAAAIDLDDYSLASELWFPLLFRVRDGAATDSWSVGPFGLLVKNTNTYISDPPGREAPTTNEFDALLGLVHVETGGRRTHLRLLWFFRISL